MKNRGFNLLGKHIDITKELEKAHEDYEIRKKAILFNLKGLKVFYRHLYDNKIICKDCYTGLITIINNTIKFINEKEI